MRASAPRLGAAAFDLNADSGALRAADWEPAAGQAVLLLTMGGSRGQVTAGPDARGRYSVKVCSDTPSVSSQSASGSKP